MIWQFAFEAVLMLSTVWAAEIIIYPWDRKTYRIGHVSDYSLL